MLQTKISVDNGEASNFYLRLPEIQSQEFSDGEFGVT